MKKLLFLINPISGSSPGTVVADRIARELKGRLDPSEFDIVFTQRDTAGQTRELAPDYSTVVGAGGDGTLCQIVQAISTLPDPPRMGIIPYGVGNDLARALGVFHVLKKKGVPGMIRMFLAGKTRRVDVIRVNGRHLFYNYFGLGNDAKISNEFARLRAKKPRTSSGVRVGLNNAFYLALGLGNIGYTIPFAIRMRARDANGREIRMDAPEGARGLLISNSGLYGGGAMVSSKTDPGDGRFEVTVVENFRHWSMLHLTRFLKRPLDSLSSSVVQFSTDRLHVAVDGETFFQIDGEEPDPTLVGAAELEFDVSHQMEMIVP